MNLADPDLYHHWTEVTLRFSDQDSMGHVNNAAYLSFLEASRVDFIYQFMAPAGLVDTVLARITVDFLREAHYPGTVRVGARLSALGTRSMTSVYGVFLDGECLATATCVNVFFDTRERRSTLPPPEVRSALEAELAPGAPAAD